MDNLVCSECGVTYYSAAASEMVLRGELCDCGGRLIERDRLDAESVAARLQPGPEEPGPQGPSPDGRRFKRPEPTE